MPDRPWRVALVLAVLGAHLALAQPAATPAQTEGPYYKSGSPERDILYAPQDSGQRIRMSGQVLDRQGLPASQAWMDIWQADAAGRYDNSGYAFRGHLYADTNGRYSFRTVLPAEYPGRTLHIHVKVRAGDGPVLTTQLYFPTAAERNARDSLFDPRLLVRWVVEGQEATFDFVLP